MHDLARDCLEWGHGGGQPAVHLDQMPSIWGLQGPQPFTDGRGRDHRGDIRAKSCRDSCLGLEREPPAGV